MPDPTTRRDGWPLWVELALWSLGGAAAATLLHPLPLLRQPAADLRHLVPPTLSFLVLHLLGWALVLALLVAPGLWLHRKGVSGTAVGAGIVAVVVIGLAAWPWGRVLLLRGGFLEAPSEVRIVLVREGIDERPAVMLRVLDPDSNLELLRDLHRDGTADSVLFDDPFYPEPGWDSFVQIDVAGEEMEDLVARAVDWMLRRPRPLEPILEEPEEPRILETAVLMRGDRLYGVTREPGGLEPLLDRLAEALPSESRRRLDPWRR